MTLTPAQLEAFVQDGYVRLEAAFPAPLAEAARAILWRDLPGRPADPASWPLPVVRLGMYTDPPFVEAANTPALHAAFDQLVGPGRWLPCRAMGTFPVRFPSDADPGDTGWHVDAAFPGPDPADYGSWRVDGRSRGRALLLLFLFSDVDAEGGATRIRVGSHRDVARLLADAGEGGLAFGELAARLDGLPARPEVSATGPAGTVYLCHPFLAHAASSNRSGPPRFMAQPPLLFRPPAGQGPPDLFATGYDPAGADAAPAARAIAEALAEG